MVSKFLSLSLPLGTKSYPQYIKLKLISTAADGNKTETPMNPGSSGLIGVVHNRFGKTSPSKSKYINAFPACLPSYTNSTGKEKEGDQGNVE